MLKYTNETVEAFINSGEPPMPDPTYGDGYRCSTILKDGTELPCVIIRRNDRLIDSVIKSIEAERRGRMDPTGGIDPQREFVKALATGGNRLSFHEIDSIRPSRFAIPLPILEQIEGETVMAWTGFVLEMADSALFTYGSSYNFAFFDIPGGYQFSDVVTVHNHAFVDRSGRLVDMRADPENTNLDYDEDVPVFRERSFFECFVDRP